MRRARRTLFDLQALPDELLLLIFSEGLASTTPHNARAIVRYLVRISSACKRFRTLALETRRLWTTIHFEQLQFGRAGDTSNFGLLELFLARSRGAPIELAISISRATSSIERLLVTLAPHWHRTRSIDIMLSGTAPSLFPIEAELPSLRVLKVSDTAEAPHELFRPQELIQGSADNLECLSIRTRRQSSRHFVNIGGRTIKHFCFEGQRYTTETAGFIDSCPNLVSMELHSWDLTPIRCPSLESLTLVGPAAQQDLGLNIIAVNLRHLALTCPITCGEWPLQGTGPPPIFPALRTLTVTRPHIYSAHPLVSVIIRNNPSIVAITLSDLNHSAPSLIIHGIARDRFASAPAPNTSPSAPSSASSSSDEDGEESLTHIAPATRYIRVGTPSGFYRSTPSVVELARATSELLISRPSVRVDWSCAEMSDEDPASILWIESKLPDEVKVLRETFSDRFKIDLSAHPTDLKVLFPGNGGSSVYEQTATSYEANY